MWLPNCMDNVNLEICEGLDTTDLTLKFSAKRFYIYLLPLNVKSY